MKKIVLVFFLLSLAEITFCQIQNNEIDSLAQTLKVAKEDSNKVNTLNLLCLKYLNLGDIENALNTVKEAITLAQNIGYRKGLANAFDRKGIIYSRIGNYSEALKNHFAALKIQEEIQYKQGMANCYINIGNIYNQQNNNSDALKSYSEALKIEEEIDQKMGIAVCYNNIGNVYMNMGNHEEALKNYTAALKIGKEVNYKDVISYCYANIGIIYEAQGKYEESLINLLASLKIAEEVQNNLDISDSYISLGALHIKMNRYSKAEEYLNKGLYLSQQSNSKDRIRLSYANLAKLDSARGNLLGAYQYLQLSALMKDSILNAESDKHISQLKIQFETEKKDKEIEIKNIKIENQNVTIRYITMGFIVLILFALIYFRLLSQKRKTTFTHKVLETEMKALRSQMNPHFTFNVLNSIQYYVGGNDMKAAELYLNKFSSLIRMILDQSRDAYVTLEQEINTLNLYLELEEMLFEKKFNYSIQVDENINQKMVFIPGMLIQPIIENAIKHGITHKKGEAIISVSFKSQNEILLCIVKDNGIGRFAAEKLKSKYSHKSVATDIIKERMEALSLIYNIKLSYNIEDIYNSNGEPEGTEVSMQIPFKKLELEAKNI